MGENPSRGQIKRVCGRGHWKPSEDSKLRELVAVFGPQNWNFIADMLDGSRSGKSCRLRWYNQLDPKIDKRGLTEEEEQRLMEAHSVYGSRWAFISRHLFPGRTDNAVKNHWHVLMARKHRSVRKRTTSNVSANCTQITISPHERHECNHNNVNDHDDTNSTPQHYDQLQNVHYCGEKDDTILGSTADDRCPLESASFLKITDHQTPVFIDFLGVGA